MPDSSIRPEVFVTADGSPTVSLARADGFSEQMHHRGGALAESLFIYGDALSKARAHGLRLRILSLGLGLAYNELITFAAADDQVEKLWSFEIVPELRKQFLAWAAGRANPTLDDVAARVAAHHHLDVEALRTRVNNALATGRLEVRADFPKYALDLKEITLVYYDAFSNKMDPHLWRAPSLVGYFAPRLGARAVFATYAATGELNRALQALAFGREKKKGFLKRRQSTLALRGMDR